MQLNIICLGKWTILANLADLIKRNIVVEENKRNNVALSARAIDKMKAGDADKVDIGEYNGLRVVCGKTGVKSFVYRYRSPIDNSLKKNNAWCLSSDVPGGSQNRNTTLEATAQDR